MSAKHKTVTALDDRVARMSDLRTLVDTVASMLAALDARQTALETHLGLTRDAVPEGVP